MARSTDIVSHWHLLIDQFNVSSAEFYKLVKENIGARKVPDTTDDEIEWKEGGIASAYRRYLRVQRGRLMFDLCAAPWGSSYFFSWWLVEESIETSVLAGIVAAIVIWGTFFILFAKFGLILSIPILCMLVVGLLFAIRQSGIRGERSAETFILTIPMVARLYRALFKPSTYYALDTRLAFQESVHRAVVDAIDSIRTAHGLRSLTPDEAKPTMRNLVG